MKSELISRLNLLGFSDYEAGVYMSLLQHSPVTAYEAAKGAGIPTSKVYGVMAKLVEKGVVLERSEGEKRLFSPKDVGQFLRAEKEKVEENLSYLEEALPKFATAPEVSYLWNMQSRQSILEKAMAMIAGAKDFVLMHSWPQESIALQEAVASAVDRGVRVTNVSFGKESTTWGLSFLHPISDTIFQEKGGRSLILVVDGFQALLGTFSEDKPAEGAWSENQGFVNLAEDYIKHDIYVMKIVRRFGQEMQNVLEKITTF
jgi:sugar-specific transcriptional regulator TrmB